MKIAILGWGSLLWDTRPEFDERHNGWIDDGPSIDIEFSRISGSRDRALTLVIDDVNGRSCKVSYAISNRRNPDDAICDLKCREGTILKRIGFYFVDGSKDCKPNVPHHLPRWAEEKAIDVVVWTGLESNFEDKTGREYTIEAAIEYLQSLPPDGKAKAAEYVWRAPSFIKTGLRQALGTEPWFAVKANDINE